MSNFVFTGQMTYRTPPKPPSLPPEAKGRMVQVIHDQFSAHWNYTNRPIYAGKTGTPATCKAADTESSHMNEPFQFWWRDWIAKLAPGRSMEENNKEFCDITHGAKAFTNNWGTEAEKTGYRNYIMRWHMDKEEARQESIVCTGNPLICRPGDIRNFAGEPALGVLSIDRSYPLPDIEEMMKNPLWVCFIGYATVITKTYTRAPIFPSTVMQRQGFPPANWKGNRQVDPFPNNVQFPTQMTPVPFASWKGEQVTFGNWSFGTLHCRVKYIRMDRLVTLPDNEFPISPFVKKVL